MSTTNSTIFSQHTAVVYRIQLLHGCLGKCLTGECKTQTYSYCNYVSCFCISL